MASDTPRPDERHAMTLRLEMDLYERLRREAFDRHVPMSQIVRDAITLRFDVSRGCDVCGKPSTHVTTPGGFRGCDDHLTKGART